MTIETFKALRRYLVVCATLCLRQCLGVSSCTDVYEAIAAPVAVRYEAV